MVTIPKLAYPFRVSTIGRIRAATVEQDSEQEVSQCVYAILGTDLGAREDYPEMGIESPVFTDGIDLDDIRAQVEEYEPRAEILTDSQLEGLVQRVSVRTNAIR